MSEDENHLKLLSLFHYVVGALAGVFALFPIIHLVIGLSFVFAPGKFQSGGESPEVIGWLFVFVASLFIIGGLIFATLIILNGWFLAHRRHYVFCLAVGGAECVFMPFGTVLGVFTIIVLMRDSVKRLFGAGGAAASARPPVR